MYKKKGYSQSCRINSETIKKIRILFPSMSLNMAVTLLVEQYQPIWEVEQRIRKEFEAKINDLERRLRVIVGEF